MNRRLAAILAADVAGYSRLIERDEAGTLAALRERRKTILDPTVARHHGRVVKVMGDGVLVEFGSAVNAVACAIELQKQFAAANETVADDRRIVLRVGVNLGDVVVEGGDLYGDGVIIAIRLQAMAEPGGICISGSVHEQVAGKLDAAFDDLGLCEVKNSSKLVRVDRVRMDGREPMQAPPVTALSIAVLPFDNMSGDPGQQYLSDGITEDIITELSRFGSLSVASRNASFHLGAKRVNAMQAARDLAVAYVVEGSMRKSGDRLRITVQLIDTRTGNHVWAERYDRESSDIFAVLDEVVSAIVATLEGRMIAASAALSRKQPTSSWTAYDYLLQGRELCNCSKEPEAVPFFSWAVAIDPNFGLAHAWLAMALTIAFVFQMDKRLLEDAARAARTALELDANDPVAHWATAMVMMWSGRHEPAGRHFDRAIALNPADIQIRADRANLLRYGGRPDAALAAIDDALKQGPFAPHWFLRLRAEFLFDLKRYQEAVNALNGLAEKSLITQIYLAAGHAHLGDRSEAARALAAAREIRPTLGLRVLAAVMPHADKAALDHLLGGLRRAGLPE